MHDDRERGEKRDSAEDRDFKGGPGEGREGKGGCKCGGGCDCDPGCACRGGGDCEEMDHLDYTAELWKGAFHEALHEARVEALKAKIKSLMGKSLEETAEVVVKSMLEEWKQDMKREADKAKEAETPKPDAALKERIKQAWKKGPQ